MPEKEEQFVQNYDALVQQLDNLNDNFSEVISQAKHPEIIVSHAAYGYWASRYGLKQISISGLSTSNEPSQKELGSIVSTAKEHTQTISFLNKMSARSLPKLFKVKLVLSPLLA